MTININASVADGPSIDSQWLFSPSDLDYTPTVLAGLMKPEEERKNRRKGVSLIYKVAEKIGLYMATHLVSTAALFFHRFFMRRLMRPVGYASVWQGQPTFAYQDIALSALYLATKVEECYKRLDDIVNAGLEMDSRIDQGVSAGGSDRESEESTLRQSILWGEERLLETLCFDLIIDHPQKHLILAAKKLGVDRGLTRIAYAHIHDACRDPVCTFYEPPVLAAGAFALACSDVDVDPSEFSTSSSDGAASSSTLQNWLQVFDVSQEEVDECSTALRTVRDSMLLTEPRTTLKQPPTSGFNSSTSTPYPQAQAQNGLGPFSSTNSPFHPPSSSTTSRVGTPSAAMPPPAGPSSHQHTSRPPSRHGHTGAETLTRPFVKGAEGFSLKSPGAVASGSEVYTLRSPSAAVGTKEDYTLKSPSAAATAKHDHTPKSSSANVTSTTTSTGYTLKSPSVNTSYTLKSPGAATSATESTTKPSDDTSYTLKSPSYTLKSPSINTTTDVEPKQQQASQPPTEFTLQSPTPAPAQEEAARKVSLEQKQTERATASRDDEEEEGEICD